MSNKPTHILLPIELAEEVFANLQKNSETLSRVAVTNYNLIEAMRRYAFSAPEVVEGAVPEQGPEAKVREMYPNPTHGQHTNSEGIVETATVAEAAPKKKAKK